MLSLLNNVLQGRVSNRRMEDLEVITPKKFAKQKCEYEKERDANVVALAWLCKPLEDVVEQLYVPSNPKYLHRLIFVSLNIDGQDFDNPIGFVIQIH
jgi:hypothetical protein